MRISIHASAKEATLKLLLPHHILVYFNSRFREGSDLTHVSATPSRIYFNSRFREGSDFVRA